MTDPTEVKINEYTYAVEQKASVNAYFDVDVNGESFRLQITARHGVTAAQITATTNELIAALKVLREANPRQVVQPASTVANERPEQKKYEQKPVPASEVPPDLPSPSEGGADFFKDSFDYIVIEPQLDEKC